MARKIFKASEVKVVDSKVLIVPPQIPLKKEKQDEIAEVVEEAKEAEELGGREEEVVAQVEEVVPREETRDELLEQAKRIKEEAEHEAEKIKKEAEEAAFKIIQKNTTEARKLKEQAENDAKAIVEEAKVKAEEIEQQAKIKAEAFIEQAKKEAYEEAREEGYTKGAEEVDRLIERLHTVLNAAIDKRKEIIENAEQQLIDLVLLIVRKVVKIISEKEKKVVIENIKEALKKVKGETEVTIRVNLSDLDLASKQKKSLISKIEGLERVSVEEDNRVDPGGCIIETSLGDIDARIQTQLQIIVEKIRELTPVKRG